MLFVEISAKECKAGQQSRSQILKIDFAGRRAGNQCRHFVKELPTSARRAGNGNGERGEGAVTALGTGNWQLRRRASHKAYKISSQQSQAIRCGQRVAEIGATFGASDIFCAAPYAPSYFISSCFRIRPD